MTEETSPGEELNSLLSNDELEIDVLDDEKIFTVPMSGAYGKRIQALGAWMTESKKPEEIIKIYQLLTESGDSSKYDHFTFHMETILILLKEIETQAREAGCVKKVKMKDLGLPLS